MRSILPAWLRSSILARNTLANVFGHLTAPALSFVMVPFYLHTLGLDGYGIIAFVTTLTGVLGIFSSGIGWALQREVARRNASADGRTTLGTLVRSFEFVYWIAAAFASVSIFALSRFISASWLQTSLPIHDVALAVSIAGVRVGLAFPIGLYNGVLSGLQRQVTQNLVYAVTALLGAASALAVVTATKSIVAFAISDAAIAVVTSVTVRHFTFRVVRRESPLVGFDVREILRLWRLSASLVFIHGVGAVIKQLDRVIVSTLLPVASLGVYAASTTGGGLLRLAQSPFFNAVYPQTCGLANSADRAGLDAHLIRNAKVVATLGLAAALPAALFAEDLLLAWTRNDEVASTGSLPMAIYLFGSFFVSNTNVLYQGQTAMGRVRPALAFNTLALIWFPALLWFLVRSRGIEGGALAWLAYGVLGWVTVVATTPAMLPRGFLRRYFTAVLSIAAVSLPVAGSGWFLAEHLFDARIMPRVLCAVASGTTILAVVWLLFFGSGWLPGPRDRSQES